MQIEVSETQTPRQKPVGDLGFGRVFSDHVFRMDYEEARGWYDARIEPYAPIELDPAASSLHYAQAVFEGLKAFRGVDNVIRLFRPDRHADRFQQSCDRMCIPRLPEGAFLEAVEHAVAQDHEWVPTEEGAALYVRPFVFATEAFLGVRPAKKYSFMVLMSPVGAYYAKGFAPVRIWVERHAVRAARGGVGASKTAANYAASLHAATAAKARGYDQVLWTDAEEHRFVEEVGTMNIFLHLGDEIVTPSLDSGTILPGVTRDSVIRLLRERGENVVERRIDIDEVIEAHRKGTLREVFGTGTAAVVSPVAELGFDDGDLTVGDGGVGPLARGLFDEIVALQRGEAEDRWGWTRVVGSAAPSSPDATPS
ncbi:MAG TPA: branched-chain amino acid aminotransferase [Sandaracinaceae bacterium LLY-WYZ-13_1]|nr:branched-chain amino acid aminotransferase [Sandaracinaceae bacterium LLY-WYZ-13_1]